MSSERESDRTPGDLVYEGAPGFPQKPSWRAVGLRAAAIAAAIAALSFLEAQSVLSPSPSAAVWVWTFFHFIARPFLDVHQAKKTRYRIRTGGLEWEMPGIAGVERAFAPWDRVRWLGPVPESPEAVRQLERDFGLTPGRIRSFPPAAVLHAPRFRAIYRGARLHHAIEFFPTPEYVARLKAAAPPGVPTR